MTTARRIAKNTGVLLVSQLTSILLGFFFTVLTVRYLGAQGFGILSFALSFTGIFSVLSDLGLAQLTVREVARDKSLTGKYIGNSAGIKALLTVITLTLIVVSINLLNYPEQTKQVVYIIALSVIFSSFNQIFYSIFQAHEKMEYQSVGQILSSVILIIGAFFAITSKLDVVSFSFIYLSASTLVLFYNLIFSIKIGFLKKLYFDRMFWRGMIKEAWPFWLSGVFVFIYFRIDMVMLSMMKGETVVGWYAAPYKLIDALSFIPAATTSALYPVFSKFHSNGNSPLKKTFVKSFNYLFIIALPIAICTTILSDKIILIIYGNDFTPSIIVLQVLIWASFLSFINWTPATLLNSIDKQRTMMQITFLGAILNIALNLLLIPNLSYVGAGIATVLAELLVCLLLLHYVNQNMHELPINKKTMLALLPAAITGLFTYTIREYSLFLIVPLATIVYLILLIASRTIDKEDIDLLKHVLGK